MTIRNVVVSMGRNSVGICLELNAPVTFRLNRIANLDLGTGPRRRMVFVSN
jgi:hypothetical protein